MTLSKVVFSPTLKLGSTRSFGHVMISSRAIAFEKSPRSLTHITKYNNRGKIAHAMLQTGWNQGHGIG